MTTAPPLAAPRAPASPPPGEAEAWTALHARAAAPYRGAGRFAWHFARGKLGYDPVFRALIDRGHLRVGGSPMRVVDIGCGQGLLASLLQAAAEAGAEGRWPARWPAEPRAAQYTGIELMQRDVDRARAALAGLPLAPQFVCADMREAAIPAAELVVILDCLHYIDHAAQADLLTRVRNALVPGGRLVTRVGDTAAPRGFALSQWVDRVVTQVRGHRVPPTFGRSVAEWTALLEGLGFAVRSSPMSISPLANVMLVAERPADAT